MPRKATRGDFHLDLEKGGSLSRRRTALLPDGSYIFEDELEVDGSLNVTIITCTAWLLELYELAAGEILFLTGNEEVAAGSKHFGVLYPPFTITQVCFKQTKSAVCGIATTAPLPPELTSPTLFEFSQPTHLSGVAQAIQVLRSARNQLPVVRTPEPTQLSRQAKKLIDENYIVYPAIGRIAERLGVTHEHLSRQFKRDFAMSPSSYLRQLRLADVPLKLAKGEDIVNISLDVGYNDLSRFYKQFRKQMD